MKAILVAGTHAGVGKTTAALGLTAALVKRGLRVQTFKVGPDWFDPGYLAAASGRPCLNLDLWMMPKRAILETYVRGAEGADVAVIDGMWGLFDGMSMKGAAVSTADVDGLLGAPVLLVVDASPMMESAAAEVHGFATFGELPVPACLFNRVGKSRYERLRGAVQVAGSVEPVGFLSVEEGLRLPERGASMASADTARLAEILPALGDRFAASVKVGALLEMADAAAAHKSSPAPKRKAAKARARIAVARDEAFHFYYDDNLSALSAGGAELVPFSPLKDAKLPSGVGAIYLGGGFDEIYAERLDKNKSMREAVRAAIDGGMPTYAECGGLLYLTKHFVGSGVRAWEMAGILPGEVRLSVPSSGYASVESARGSFLVAKGEKLRGHEFRVCAWSEDGGAQSVYRVTRPGRDESRAEGYAREHLHVSSVHLHFSSCPDVVKRFVDAAEAHAKKAPRKKPARPKRR